MQKSAHDNPLISVLICSFNAENFIKSTLDSVLNQSYSNIEVLILDNNSTDQTLDIIKKTAKNDPRVKIYANKVNLGSYPGLNYLLERSKGKYIAINDHDDIWHPEKLEKQIEFLENNSNYKGCGSAIINWYERYGKFIYCIQKEKSDIAWHTSLVFRNSGHRYDSRIKVATDFYFMKNILCKNKSLIQNFHEPLVLRRIYKNNLSEVWMKKTSIPYIFSLKIRWIDKLVLLNRILLPQKAVEIVMLSLGRKVPTKYSGYLMLYKKIL